MQHPRSLRCTLRLRTSTNHRAVQPLVPRPLLLPWFMLRRCLLFLLARLARPSGHPSHRTILALMGSLRQTGRIDHSAVDSRLGSACRQCRADFPALRIPRIRTSAGSASHRCTALTPARTRKSILRSSPGKVPDVDAEREEVRPGAELTLQPSRVLIPSFLHAPCLEGNANAVRSPSRPTSRKSSSVERFRRTLTTGA